MGVVGELAAAGLDMPEAAVSAALSAYQGSC